MLANNVFRVGARRSPLARAQAKKIGRLLEQRLPGAQVTYSFMRTSGDDGPGSGKDRFTDAIEDALLTGDLDLAVHSLKDLDVDGREGLHIAAIPAREEPRDVVTLREGIELGPGVRIGTSSLRRRAQLATWYPGVEVVPIRGNVDTRLKKLRAGEVDGVVLAAAGLRRLDLWPSGTRNLRDPWLPAPGQGALAVQARVGDQSVSAAMGALEDPEARTTVTAEREFLAGVGSGCNVPTGALAVIGGETLVLRAAIYDVDGAAPVMGMTEGPRDKAHQLGRELASKLLGFGGQELIDRALTLQGQR